MAVTIPSNHFGEIEVSHENILNFPVGLIGLPGNGYALIKRSDDAVFSWLHSTEDPGLAIPITNPWGFFADYTVDLTDDDAERLGIDSQVDASTVWVTVRAAAEIKDFCANLHAPIIIVDRVGYQVINQAPHAAVRAPLFSAPESNSDQAA